MPLTDHQAAQLLHAINTHNLDYLTSTIPFSIPAHQAHSLLRTLFNQAAQDHLNLLHPPPDFHPWLLRTAYLNQNNQRAKPNTVRQRLMLLSHIYQYLIDHDLLLRHPLHGMERPPQENHQYPLLARARLTRLHLYTQTAVPELFVALILIDQHALKVRELLALQWTDFDFETARPILIRTQNLTPLTNDALQALERLRPKAGGVFATGKVFSYKYEREIRAAIYYACKVANIPYTPPSELRKIALRDHLLTPEQAGYPPESGTHTLKKATRLAREVAERLSE